MIRFQSKLVAVSAVLFPLVAIAAPVKPVVVDIHSVTAEGIGKSVGTVTIEEVDGGLKFVPNLSGLPAGERGFHVHENASCEPKEKDGKMVAAGAAGPHYDPSKSGHHNGPSGEGHAGDLPALPVEADGTAKTAVTTSRLKLADLTGRALMIHAGGDNYSDTPKPLGGGGDRIACGVIPGR